jgi:hypothetical protein
MTERIFGPSKDNFDDALSRLKAAVLKSETEAELLREAADQLFSGTNALVAGR